MTQKERQALRWRQHVQRQAGNGLTELARRELSKHNMELEKLRGKRAYLIYGETGPPAEMTEDELRALLIDLREGRRSE